MQSVRVVMEYYTYAYLREDKTPYYIGKGKDGRAYVKNRQTKPPKDKSRIIFLKKNLTEEEALKHEKYMSNVFGRKDLGTGILHNKTDGGEGTFRRIITDKEKEKMRQREIGNKRCLGRTVSEETRRKISEANKGKKRTEEQKENLKNRKTKSLKENPSPHTLYMRQWSEKNREKCREYSSKHLKNKNRDLK
jgi:NUMOD3 motif